MAWVDVEEEVKQKGGWVDVDEVSPVSSVLPSDKTRSLGESVLQGAYNFPESLVNLGKNIVTGIPQMAKVGMKFATGQPQDLEMGKALYETYKERYGGEENFKKTISEDPAGFLADVSSLFTGIGGGIRGIATQGGKLAKAGQVASRVGSMADPLNPIILPTKFTVGKLGSRKPSPEMMENLKLSEETGVPLTPAEIKRSTPLGLIETYLGQNIGSAGTVEKFREGQLLKNKRYALKVQEGMGGMEDMLSAGQKAQEFGWKRWKHFSQKAQEKYNAIPIPDDFLVNTNTLKDVASGYIDELGNMGGSSIKRILGIAEGSVESQLKFAPGTIVSPTGQPFTGAYIPKITWKQLLDDRSSLNKMASATTDWNKKRILRDLVNSIDEDISILSGEVKTPAIKTKLDDAISFYKKGDEEIPGIQTFKERRIQNALTSKSPEKIVDQFIKPNNVSDVKRLRAVVGNDGMQPIKQAWLEKLLTKGEEQSFSPTKFSSSYGKYDIQTLASFLSPQELVGLNKLNKISLRMRTAEKAANIGENPIGMMSTVWSALINPKLTVMYLLSPRQLAKQYFENPNFQKMLLGMKDSEVLLKPSLKRQLMYQTGRTMGSIDNKNDGTELSGLP